MASHQVIRLQSEGGAIIKKWNVDTGTTLYEGRIVLLYQEADKGGSDATGGEVTEPPKGTAEKGGKVVKLKSKHVGRVTKLCAHEGETIQPGEALLEIELGCSHPVVINELCAECGADLQKDGGGVVVAGIVAGGSVEGPGSDKRGGEAGQMAGPSLPTATIPMVHSIPQLKVSHEQAQQLGRADTERLLKEKKLVLLVDLDQTLIHTTHDNIPNNLKDVHHFQLLGSAQNAWYHTRLRPGTAHFLSEMYHIYELHICTFGVRPYAHTVAHILDRDARLFSNRILSRDECFDYNSKVANLQALFPCGDELVCIIDDRVDVWNFSKNLIPVKPYQFFRNTSGDTNLPNPLHPNAKTDSTSFFAKGVHLRSKQSSKKSEGEVPTVNKEKSVLIEKEDKIEALDEKISEEGNEVKKKIEQVDAVREDSLGDTKDEIVFEEEEEEGDLIDVEDEDDYLLYLEVILKKVHTLFYKVYNKEVEGVADVKWIIQELKSHILKGCTIVFSGLIPISNNSNSGSTENSGDTAPDPSTMARSEGWSRLALGLGALVGRDLEAGVTTHLVAANPSTFKVHKAKKMKGVNVVTPKWLITCAHRWERVEEALFNIEDTRLVDDVDPSEDDTTSNMMLLLGPPPPPPPPPPESAPPPLVLSHEAVEAIKDQFDEEFTSGSSSSSESEQEQLQNDESDSENPKSDLGGDTDEEEVAEERRSRRKKTGRKRKRKKDEDDGEEEEDNDVELCGDEEWSQLAHQIERGLDEDAMECDDDR